jgi:hypothetical protein
LKVVASSNLQGFGENDGTPVIYEWTMGSLMPLALPWLVLLGLFAVRHNRTGQAWWIWLPLLVTAGLPTALQLFENRLALSEGVVEIGPPLLAAAAFGLAALWLLAPILARRPWPLVFLGAMTILMGFGGIALIAAADLDSLPTTLGLCFLLAPVMLGLTLALTLAGLLSRKRFSTLRLSVWAFLWLMAGWLGVSAPFYLIALVTSSEAPRGMLLLAPVALGLVNFGVLLPYLILSGTNGLYRQRLRDLFGPREAAPLPPPLPAAPPVQQAA